MKAVWPDSFVEEANLSQSIFTLRKILGENANGEQYIETIPKRGYRFTAAVEELQEEPLEQEIVVAPVAPARSASAIARSLKAGVSESAFRLPAAKRSVLAVSVLIMIGFSGFYFLKPSDTAARSLAVLPFVNETADPDTEYLSDGITENIINTLAQLPNVRVMARNTVFTYKGGEVDPRKAGRDLNVDVVLTGKVVQRGETLNIQTELVDVAGGSQVWGQQYNRKFADIFGVQEEIAKDISEQLRLKLTGEDQKRLAKRYTENIEAFQLYLKGRYYFDRRTPEGIRQSIEYFQEAIKKDPQYALAYAGLANSYVPSDVTLPPRDTIEKAREAAKRALEIDDTLAETHTAQARILQQCDWDWAGAEREFRRSIDLNPKYAEAHHMYSHFLMEMGRIEEAAAESRKALELDPLDVLLHIHVAWTDFYARQYDRSMSESLKLMQTESSRYEVPLNLGRVYLHQGLYDKAIEAFQKSGTLPGGGGAGQIGLVYAVSGKKHEALEVLARLKRRSAAPYALALVYAGLGDKDQALDWLQKAFQERSGNLLLLKVEPAFDGLRSDPRFTALLRQIGLPD